MEELNKKIAEWVGFTLEELGSLKSDEPYFVLHEPGGEQYNLWIGGRWDNEIPAKLYPDFTTSLDACFKYIVPRLSNYELSSDERGHFAIVWVGKVGLDMPCGSCINKEPALAFCLAVEKLIDGGKV